MSEWTAREKRAAVRLYAKGSLKEVGIAVQRTRNAVAGRFWRMGVVKQRPPVTLEEMAARRQDKINRKKAWRKQRAAKREAKRAEQARHARACAPLPPRFLNPDDRRACR